MDHDIPEDRLWAMLDWQVELGATEAIGDAPVDRFEMAAAEVAPAAAAAAAPSGASENRSAPPTSSDGGADPVAHARRVAAAARDLNGLRDAMAAYPHCELRQGARNLVFADGNPAARVMIVGEAPGREEDMKGLPFVGRAGRLLDNMFAAIGLSRGAEDAQSALYIANVLPWRPPQNRDPKPDEIAMMVPFVQRHVELAAPEVLILMGNISCQAGLGKRGITRLRGTWAQAYGKPAMPMFHPAYLLRNPAAKREAWADLLAVQARLRGAPA